MDDNGQKKKRRGKRSPWHEDLGVTSQKTPRWPAPVWKLVEMELFIKLLNWMTMVPEFREKIFKLVPENEPPSFEEQAQKAARKRKKSKPDSEEK